jgi:hypothetical protein
MLARGRPISQTPDPHLLLDSINIGRSIEFQNFKGYRKDMQKRGLTVKKDAKRSSDKK